MSWWLWILFWCLFWTVAGAYLAWRTWRLWPHARGFGRTVSHAWERVEQARSMVPSGPNGERSQVVTRTAADELAWNTPPAQWRERRRAERARRRDLRLDDHTEVWATWRDPLD